MLILPPGHAEATSPLRRLTARERRLVRIMAVITAVLVVGVVVSLLVTGRSTGHGCVHATYPGPVGAEETYNCGGAARQLCATVTQSRGYSPAAVQAITTECRKAGLTVG